MRLRIRDIQRYCLDDGPGIRTTVFCQGCPLRCWWCHNPETQPFTAASAAWACEDLCEYLRRDERYWRASGGGVTFSGGEPLAQADAVLPAARMLQQEGVHVAVCTSGQGRGEDVDRLAGSVDLWLIDLKSTDSHRYRQATGGDVGIALATLSRLLQRRPESVTVRVPLIAGFNDEPGQVDSLADWLTEHPAPAGVDLLPGHDLCRSPGEETVRPSRDRVEQARRRFARAGLDVAVVGARE